MNNNLDKDILISKWKDVASDDVLIEVAHEIREPIYLMLGFINVLIDTKQSENERANILKDLHKHALYSKNIIDTVYAYLNSKQK